MKILQYLDPGYLSGPAAVVPITESDLRHLMVGEPVTPCVGHSQAATQILMMLGRCDTAPVRSARLRPGEQAVVIGPGGLIMVVEPEPVRMDK